MSNEDKEQSGRNGRNKMHSPSRIPTTPQSQHLRRPKKPGSPSVKQQRNAATPELRASRLDYSAMSPTKKGKSLDDNANGGTDVPTDKESAASSNPDAGTLPFGTAADTQTLDSANTASNSTSEAQDTITDRDEVRILEAKLKKQTAEYNNQQKSWYETIQKFEEDADKLKKESKAKDVEIGKLRSRLDESENNIHNPEKGLDRQVDDLQEEVTKLNKTLQTEKTKAADAIDQADHLETRLTSLVSDIKDKNHELDQLKQEKHSLQAMNDELHVSLDEIEAVHEGIEKDRIALYESERQLKYINSQLESIFADLGSDLTTDDYFERIRENHNRNIRREGSHTSMDELAKDVSVKKRSKDRLVSSASLQDELEGVGGSSAEESGDDAGNEEDATLGQCELSDLTSEPGRKISKSGSPSSKLKGILEHSDPPKSSTIQTSPLGFSNVHGMSTEPIRAESRKHSGPPADVKKSPKRLKFSNIVTVSTEPLSPFRKPQKTITTKPSPTGSTSSLSPFQTRATKYFTTSGASTHRSVQDCWAALPVWVKITVLTLFLLLATLYHAALNERQLWLEPNGLTLQRLDLYRLQRDTESFGSMVAFSIEQWLGIDRRMLG